MCTILINHYFPGDYRPSVYYYRRRLYNGYGSYYHRPGRHHHPGDRNNGGHPYWRTYDHYPAYSRFYHYNLCFYFGGESAQYQRKGEE